MTGSTNTSSIFCRTETACTPSFRQNTRVSWPPHSPALSTVALSCAPPSFVSLPPGRNVLENKSHEAQNSWSWLQEVPWGVEMNCQASNQPTRIQLSLAWFWCHYQTQWLINKHFTTTYSKSVIQETDISKLFFYFFWIFSWKGEGTIRTPPIEIEITQISSILKPHTLFLYWFWSKLPRPLLYYG